MHDRLAVEPKRGSDLGRVVVDVRVANVDDVRRAEQGNLPADQVRSATVAALVNSGATFLCLPQSVVDQLGLPFNRERQANTVAGPMLLRVYGGARLTAMERSCDVEVMALPDGRQALLGQIPLETLDFWIDPVNQRLVGNPQHGGQWMAEVF